MDKSYFKKKKTSTILVACTFKPTQDNPAILLKVKEKFYEIVKYFYIIYKHLW